MDARALHQLHYAGQENIGAVAYGVHLHLLALDVFIHKHGAVGIHLHRSAQIPAQLLLVGGYLHGSAAQNV